MPRDAGGIGIGIGSATRIGIGEGVHSTSSMWPAISLHVPTIADAGRLAEAVDESRAELSRWMDWCTPGYDVTHAREWLAEQQRLHAAREGFEFVIEDSQGGLLGACGLNQLNGLHRFANLGYWVRTSATGRGVATAAVRRVARWAFEHTDLERLEIVVLEDNLASRRVAEKAGALREGILRCRLRHQGRSHDAVMYALVRGSLDAE